MGEDPEMMARSVRKALELNPPPPTLWMCFADAIDKRCLGSSSSKYRAELAEMDWRNLLLRLEPWLSIFTFQDKKLVLKHGRRVWEIAEALIRKEIPCWKLEEVDAELALIRFRFDEEYSSKHPDLYEPVVVFETEEYYSKQLSEAKTSSKMIYIPILQTFI